MLKKIINIFCLLLFFIFIILTTTFYFSDNNIRKTNKSRSLYSVKLITNTQNLPLLKNDTDEVIEYVENKTSKNKKKYHFWKLLDNAQ